MKASAADGTENKTDDNKLPDVSFHYLINGTQQNDIIHLVGKDDKNTAIKVPLPGMSTKGINGNRISINQIPESGKGYQGGSLAIDEGSKSFTSLPLLLPNNPIYPLVDSPAFKKANYIFTVNYFVNNKHVGNLNFQFFDPDLNFEYSIDGGKSFTAFNGNSIDNPVKIPTNSFTKGIKVRMVKNVDQGGAFITYQQEPNDYFDFSVNNEIAKLSPKSGVTSVPDGTDAIIRYSEGNDYTNLHDFYFRYVDQDMTASDASIYTGTAVTPDVFKAGAGDQNISIWDGKQDMTGKSYSEQGIHYVTLKAKGYKDKTVRLVVSQAPAKPTQATGTVTQPQKPAPSQPSTTPGTTVVPTAGENAPVIGQVVYSVGPIYMYKTPTFSTASRVSYYKQYKRVNRPMFKVIDYAKSANGALRYKVKDVNHRGD
ncbi:hypothetical protein PL11_002150 [Lentilactobacillus curieae]|uniref:Uncharacterized protein n=1 Tax=Lentilactobacillus curieae TaxID=1138822 RepID=A0A1S6QGR5_9LACO|nr:hypothetical protein [Lentilactobacillus curieae]AQW20798.1 hypothetical protein PL11_002150 [Lentilactobacillus curieae]